MNRTLNTILNYIIGMLFVILLYFIACLAIDFLDKPTKQAQEEFTKMEITYLSQIKITTPRQEVTTHITENISTSFNKNSEIIITVKNLVDIRENETIKITNTNNQTYEFLVLDVQYNSLFNTTTILIQK